MNKSLKSNSGMTGVEIIIMVLVLGVVGLITFPKFQEMLHQSREGRTKTGLADIRGGIAIYYSDNYGLFPSDEGTPETRLKQVLVPQYMKTFPKVELSHLYSKNLDTVHDRIDNGGDWTYTTLNGFVGVNSTHLDSKGLPISNW